MNDDQGALNHLEHGEVGTAIHDVVVSAEEFIGTLPPAVQNFVTLMKSQAGQILGGLVNIAANDVIVNGLNTASFTKAASDVSSQLISQGVSVGTQDIYTALNAAVSYAKTLLQAAGSVP